MSQQPPSHMSSLYSSQQPYQQSAIQPPPGPYPPMQSVPSQQRFPRRLRWLLFSLAVVQAVAWLPYAYAYMQLNNACASASSNPFLSATLGNTCKLIGNMVGFTIFIILCCGILAFLALVPRQEG